LVTKHRVSVRQFIRAIERLPSDNPVVDVRKWYLTQKQHWIGWLKDYHTSGAYGRKTGLRRDARYAYNHIVEPKMLLWLLPAAGVSPKLVRVARAAAAKQETMMAQSGAMRRVVPWEVVAARLWAANSGTRK